MVNEPSVFEPLKFYCTSKMVSNVLKKAKEDSVQALRKKKQQESISSVKDLTSEKHGRSTDIQDKPRRHLRDKHESLSRWTEYCSEIFVLESYGDSSLSTSVARL